MRLSPKWGCALLALSQGVELSREGISSSPTRWAAFTLPAAYRWPCGPGEIVWEASGPQEVLAPCQQGLNVLSKSKGQFTVKWERHPENGT